MKTFLQKHAASVTGILTGFDRRVFRGSLREISYVNGMRRCLSQAGVLHKAFKHRMKANSLKMYNKHPHLLRVEMTMNDPSDFKAFRPRARDPEASTPSRPWPHPERIVDASLQAHEEGA